MASGSTAIKQVPVVEVVVCGELDTSSTPLVNDLLHEAMELAPKQLIINLAQCPSIDAAGVLLLLDAHRRAMRGGGTLALCSPSVKVRRSLHLARVDRLLQIVDDHQAESRYTQKEPHI